jgi:glucose/mannose transport system permease protein
MKSKGWERWAAILTVLPSVLAIAVFVYGFIGWTVFVSLTKWVTAKPDYTFVGLANFQRILLGSGIDSQRFYLDIRNLIGFTVLFLICNIVIGFGLALLIDSRLRGEHFFQGIYLMPYAVSAIVTGVVWRWLFTPGTEQLGATGVNKLFEYVGLGFIKPRWWTDPTVWYIHPDSAIGEFLNQLNLGFLTTATWGFPVGTFSILIATTWLLSGNVMVLYLAGIRSIPHELREAAIVDGATQWQVIRHIYIPILTPVTLTVVFVLLNVAIRLYDLTVAMTGKGPGFSTDTLAFNMFETTFRSGRFAHGAVLAVLMLIFVSAIVIPYLRYNLRSEQAQT